MVLENTYTYTARSAVDPERVVTFTLHDHSLSVGVGAPIEHVERFVQAQTSATEAGGESEAETRQEASVRPWLKPMAISVLERATRPFDVDDVEASVEGSWLYVRAWVRGGGLRVAPITLIEGRVDNPQAAQAFVQELDERQTSITPLGQVVNLLDYWATWFVAGFVMFILLQNWRRRERVS